MAEGLENSEIITPEELKEASEILTREEIETTILLALREARRQKLITRNWEEHNKKIRAEKDAIAASWQSFYSWVWNKGKNDVKNFEIGANEKSLYELLAMYFTKDEGFEKQGYSLDKGLWLYGGVGCGKTTIMKLFMVNPKINYGIVECMTIADLYKDKETGPEIINRYTYAQAICFNDLGTEIESGTSSHFGNKKNVMGEIILNHYEKNYEKKFSFHFTTNLGADEIEKFYGPRVRSRLREMCNIISLEGIEDKRK